MTYRLGMLVVESPSRVSKAIQLGNMRPANHAAVEFVNDNLVFEALFRGIEVTNRNLWWASHGEKSKIHRALFEVEESTYKASLNAAWSHEKDKYNFKQYLTFLPVSRAIFGRFVKDSDNAWVCSEFAEYLMRIANVNFIHKITKPSDVSPGDLLDSIRFEDADLYELYFGPSLAISP
jgi:hypothetical protein